MLPKDFYSFTNEKKEQAIIELIKRVFPNKIEENIYHFPFQWYYFITDKGFYFSLKGTKRLPNKEELQRLSELRDSVFSLKKNKEVENYEQALSAAKSIAQIKCEKVDEKWVNQLVFSMCKASWELEKTPKWLYPDPITHYEVCKKIHDKYLAAKEDFINEFLSVEKSCNKEKDYFIYPHELHKQISIYIGNAQRHDLESLGYMVYEVTQEKVVEELSEQYLNHEKKTVETKHLFVKLSSAVFISACQNGRLLPKGQMIDKGGNIVEVKRGRTKGCDSSHLKKRITLKYLENGEEISFDSMVELGKEFDMPKSNVSRTFKNKEMGDCVKLKKKKYLIVEL